MLKNILILMLMCVAADSIACDTLDEEPIVVAAELNSL